MFTWAAKEIEEHKGRIAALEQHVAELEKSLENARKERDAAAGSLGVAVAAGKVGQQQARELMEACTRWANSATEALEQRDAALADNAAFVSEMARIGEWAAKVRQRDVEGAIRAFLEQPHPGAALLEEHRKALVRARNDGRSSALLEVQRARAKAVQPSEAFALLTYALDCINALKEDES